MNRQHKLWLERTCHSRGILLFLLHWIEKQSSRGSLLEHLECSGIKMMRGPILYASYAVGRSNLEDTFCGGTLGVFLELILAEDVKLK